MEKEKILKTYKKANKEARKRILKKYGVSSIEKLCDLLDTSVTKKVKKLNQTELASILLNSKNCDISVSFMKKADFSGDFYKYVKKKYDTDPEYSLNKSPEDLFPSLINTSFVEVTQGIERKMEGFHNGKKDKFGRLLFVDVNIPRDRNRDSDNRMRTIDLTRLNWVVVDGVKYSI